MGSLGLYQVIFYVVCSTGFVEEAFARGFSITVSAKAISELLAIVRRRLGCYKGRVSFQVLEKGLG